MLQVIETNLSCDKDKIMDFQCRIVEVENWDSYTKAYCEYGGNKVEFKSLDMPGPSLLESMELTNLKYDNFHLSCTCTKFGCPVTKKLAYRML